MPFGSRPWLPKFVTTSTAMIATAAHVRQAKRLFGVRLVFGMLAVFSLTLFVNEAEAGLMVAVDQPAGANAGMSDSAPRATTEDPSSLPDLDEPGESPCSGAGTSGSVTGNAVGFAVLADVAVCPSLDACTHLGADGAVLVPAAPFFKHRRPPRA